MWKKTVFFIGILFIGFGFLAKQQRIYATTCSPTDASPNFTLDLTAAGSCSFATSVPGVDAGTGTTNTANLIVDNGTLTVAVGTTIGFGKVTVGTNGIVSVSGTACVGCPLYWEDADGDGYAADPSGTAVSFSSGTGKIRRDGLTSNANWDCDDGNVLTYANLVCYPDGDSDTYYATTSHSVCGGANCAAIGESATVGTDCDDTTNTKYATVTGCYNDYDGDTGKAIVTSTPFCGSTCANSGGSTTVGTDCCDDNANTYSGQTSYFTTGMTVTNLCPSAAVRPYDYNCNGSEEHYWGGGGEYCSCSPNSTTQSCDMVGGNSGFVSDPGCGNTGTYKLAGCCNPSGDCSGTAYPACGAGNLANYQYTQKCR